MDAKQFLPAFKDKFLRPFDHGLEDNNAYPGHQTYKSGNGHHPDILAGHEFFEGDFHCFGGTVQPAALACFRKKSSVMPAI